MSIPVFFLDIHTYELFKSPYSFWNGVTTSYSSDIYRLTVYTLTCTDNTTHDASSELSVCIYKIHNEKTFLVFDITV